MPDPKDLRARLDAASLTISLERSGSGSSSYAILEITSIARAALDEVEALRKEPTDAEEPPPSWENWFSCEDCGGWFYAIAPEHSVIYESGSQVCLGCAGNTALRERVKVLEGAIFLLRDQQHAAYVEPGGKVLRGTVCVPKAALDAAAALAGGSEP